MQVTQPESIKSRREGVDEEFIKFRSSPNFKGMKKFIISKIDHDKTTNSVLPTPAPEPPPPPNLEGIVKPEVQTPTEMDLSPPDVLLDLNVPTKVENVEYQKDPEEDASFDQQESMINLSNNGEGSIKVPTSSIMCRDFVRGTCKRPGTCKYAHKCDTSQLVGVYTFCRDFQNRTCSLPNCKYVHATIFEEQNFYRTGKLPPHVLAHKKIDMLQPPPPPPPGPPPPQGPPPPVPVNDMSAIYSNPPPPLFRSTEPSSSQMSCLPANTGVPMFQEQCVAEPQYLMYTEEQDKKCKFCDLMEFKLEYQKDILEKRKKSVEDLKKKAVDIKKKNKKLDSILLMVLKVTKSAAAGVNSPFAVKENSILGDTNLAKLMATYFCNAGDQALMSDSSHME